jgi:very-short-patch-repair endonuclease
MSTTTETSAADTMTSHEIAAVTGKLHGDVSKDIRALLTDLYGPDSRQQYEFIEPSKNGIGRPRKTLRIPVSVAQTLLQRYEGMSRVPTRTKELAALAAIEQVLGVTLLRQYRAGAYRIDGYDKENNVAYEIDECAHNKPKTAERDAAREVVIKAALGCRFVRIKV